MAWYHNGRKYWYHNGRKYSKKMSYDIYKLKRDKKTWLTFANESNSWFNIFHKKKKNKWHRVNYDINNYKIEYYEIEDYFDYAGFHYKSYFIKEGNNYYLEDYNSRRNINDRIIKQKLTQEQADSWLKNINKFKKTNIKKYPNELYSELDLDDEYSFDLER